MLLSLPIDDLLDLQKAARVAPRPVDGLLRPAVRQQTFKYSSKIRAGRGFTAAEFKVCSEASVLAASLIFRLQAAFPKTSLKEAATVGISIDHRRRNISQEGIQANVLRLKDYKNKLIVLPQAHKKQAGAKHLIEGQAIQQFGQILPIVQPKAVEEPRAITAV